MSQNYVNDTMQQTSFCQTPLGVVSITVDEHALLELSFLDTPSEELDLTMPSTGLLKAVKDQLTAYFLGEIKVFDLPMHPQGTDFQKKVWAELLKIPFGTTVSYREMSLRLGDEKCIRAAASANGKNPIGLMIPCHRVIGTDGKLVGYAGGLWRKQYLLQHERDLMPLGNGLLF
jgi:methylated-DNA-[protein]-cysteine S-methyltransferase